MYTSASATSGEKYTVKLYLVYMLENQKHIETTKNHDIQSRLIFNCPLGSGFFCVALFCCFDVFMTAGHNQAGASSDQGSLVKYMTPKMDERRWSFADLRYVIWCCINLRPEQMRFDDGFQLFVALWPPSTFTRQWWGKPSTRSCAPSMTG